MARLIPKVLRDHLLLYQIDYIEDTSRIKVLEKARRIGGTYMQSLEDVLDIVEGYEYTKGRPVTKVYFSSKDAETSKEYIEYCATWAKALNVVASATSQEIIDETKDILSHSLTITIEGKKRKIVALTSAPTAFNSKGGKIVWDEAALHKDQRKMWSGAKPAAMWGYPIRILSTHKGKMTFFYAIIQDILKKKVSWGHHKITIVDAVKQGVLDKILGYKATKKETEEWLDNERRDCRDEAIWQEDYLCNPQDGTTAYLTYDMIRSCVRDDTLKSWEYLRLCPNSLYMGWDIARNRDLSVVTILEDTGYQLVVRKIIAMDNMPTPKQKVIARKVFALPSLRRGCIDKTGMGIPITEDMEEEFGTGKVEGVTFTNASKEEMAVHLKGSIEDVTILYPDDDTVVESLHSIQKITTAAGNTRYDAERTEQTGHADHFWSLALAKHAAAKPIDFEIYTRKRKYKRKRINHYDF